MARARFCTALVLARWARFSSTSSDGASRRSRAATAASACSPRIATASSSAGSVSRCSAINRVPDSAAWRAMPPIARGSDTCSAAERRTDSSAEPRATWASSRERPSEASAATAAIAAASSGCSARLTSLASAASCVASSRSLRTMAASAVALDSRPTAARRTRASGSSVAIVVRVSWSMSSMSLSASRRTAGSACLYFGCGRSFSSSPMVVRLWRHFAGPARALRWTRQSGRVSCQCHGSAMASRQESSILASTSPIFSPSSEGGPAVPQAAAVAAPRLAHGPLTRPARRRGDPGLHPHIDSSRLVDMKPASALFRVLGDEARLRLLRVLAQDRFNVTELTGVLGLAQSGVARHLGLLKDAGLVEEERDGAYTYYRLAPSVREGASGPLWPLLDAQFAAARHSPELRADDARLQEVLRLRREN